MKMNSGDFTHKPRAVDPAKFRAQATGIGVTLATSAQTGAARAQNVVDRTDPACMSVVPEAEGFPARTPDDMGLASYLGPSRHRRG